METHPKHFWSEARNLFVISTSLQKNRCEYFWLLHTQDSLIQSYEYLQLQIKILMDKNNHICIFSSQHGCLRMCTIIIEAYVCVVPTQFGLTCPDCPSDGHSQLPAPGIQALAIRPGPSHPLPRLMRPNEDE